MKDNALTEPALLEVASRLRALGDPLRLRLVYLLREKEKTVSDLAREVDSSQPNVSRHLAQLHRAGMISRRQQGNQVYYRVSDTRVFRICRSLCDKIKAELDAQRGDLD